VIPPAQVRPSAFRPVDELTCLGSSNREHVPALHNRLKAYDLQGQVVFLFIL
jgi:hypothetical protein